MRKLAFIVLLALGGCQTVDQQIALDDQKCLSYGVQRGSPGYVSCRANLDRGRADVKASERFATGTSLFDALQRATQQ